MKAEAIEKFLVGDQEIATKGFTLEGSEIKPESDDCFCKHTANLSTGSNRYYVKRAAFGPEGGKMYNPWSVFGVKNDHMKQRNGRTAYEFKQVPEPSFNAYMQFLQTRNEAFLRQAERAAE